MSNLCINYERHEWRLHKRDKGYTYYICVQCDTNKVYVPTVELLEEKYTKALLDSLKTSIMYPITESDLNHRPVKKEAERNISATWNS